MNTYWILTIIFCAIGLGLTWYLAGSSKPDGTLIINESNPEKDIYRFEIDDIENLSNKKQIVIKIVKE